MHMVASLQPFMHPIYKQSGNIKKSLFCTWHYAIKHFSYSFLFNLCNTTRQIYNPYFKGTELTINISLLNCCPSANREI